MGLYKCACPYSRLKAKIAGWPITPEDQAHAERVPQSHLRQRLGTPQGFIFTAQISKQRGGATRTCNLDIFTFRADFTNFWRSHPTNTIPSLPPSRAIVRPMLLVPGNFATLPATISPNSKVCGLAEAGAASSVLRSHAGNRTRRHSVNTPNGSSHSAEDSAIPIAQERLAPGALEFLLAEYNQISEELRRLRLEGPRRYNFFVSLASAAGAVLAILIALLDKEQRDLLLVSAFLILCVLQAAAFNAWRYSIARDCNSDLNIRAIARIRVFLLSLEPAISPALTWKLDDQPSRWIEHNRSGIRRTLAILNGVVCALLVALALEALKITKVYGALLFPSVTLLVVSALSAGSTRIFERAVITAQESARVARDTLATCPNNNFESTCTSEEDSTPRQSAVSGSEYS